LAILLFSASPSVANKIFIILSIKF